jgi:endonuclease YncB( thermonuclease family)
MLRKPQRLKTNPVSPSNNDPRNTFPNLILNKVVDIKSYGFDGDGWMLGEVFLEDRNINLEMVKTGFSEVYRGKPASGLDVEPCWKAEDDARKANRGMWVLGDKYVSPRDWRQTHGN